jgi:FixJ family two-component response regulator
MREKVAIGDDDPSVRRSLKRLVQVAGFRADVYGSGEDLLNDELDDVACAVLDGTPGGISDIETRRRLSSKHPAISVIFITAADSADVRRQAGELGCTAFLPKPIRGDELIYALRGCVEWEAVSPVSHPSFSST